MVENLLQAIINHPSKNIIVGPMHIDDYNSSTSFLQSCSEYIYYNSKCLATSGIAFELTPDLFNHKFDESLFLDLVDFDWCWRLELNGFKVFKILNVNMPHRLGICEKKFCGITYHVPAPFRHYFQFRDTLRMSLRSYVPIKSKIRLVGILPIKIVLYPFLMQQGFQRFIWMLKGIYSFILKQHNVGLAYYILCKQHL
jgi:rhamnosyltransferase